MKLPRNTWCPGSGRAASQATGEYTTAYCPECGYPFRGGRTPKHRPKFNPTKPKEV